MPWSEGRLSLENRALGAVAIAKFAFHVVTAGMVGREVNEYYFTDLSKHLDLGYVDVATLGPLVWRFAREVFGESLVGTRLLSAAVGGATVFLTGLMARRLGGRAFAQVLAGGAVALTPWLLRASSAMTLNAYEPLFWTLASLLFLVIVKDDRPDLWPALGLVLGLGIMVKPTILLFAFGIAVGLVATPRRAHLRTKQLWIGVAIAVACLLPMLVWNVEHGWVSLDFGKSRRLPMNPAMAVLTLLLLLLPAAAPLVFLGLRRFFARNGPPLAALGIAYVAAVLTVLLVGGKNYYVLPLHAVVFAAGATEVERWRRPWARALVAVGVVANGLFWLPLNVPFLPLDAFDAYCKIAYPNFSSQGMYSARVLYLGRSGWEETADVIGRMYEGMPTDERASTALFARRYWTAAPLNFYAEAHRFPRAISGDVQYWLWGPRDYDGARALLIGFEEDEARRLYDDVDRIVYPLSTSPGEVVTLFRCRRPRADLHAAWASLRTLGEVVLPSGELPPIR